MNCFRCLILPLLVAALTVLNAPAQSTVFATGLQTPIRLLFTPRGSLLVSEGGPFPATANTGRVSILDRSGNRRTLLEGLPPGRHISQTCTDPQAWRWTAELFT
jgi:hypothetical protein